MSFSPVVQVVSTHDISEVAAFLKKSKASIYSDLSRNPSSLPPRIEVPNSSRLLFANLHIWAAGLIKTTSALPTVEASQTKKKRGRPSNLELQRRKEEKKGGAERVSAITPLKSGLSSIQRTTAGKGVANELRNFS
jgi:hypothetical protein